MLPGWWTTHWQTGRVACPETSWKLCNPSPPCPMHLFHVVPQLHPLFKKKKTVIVKSFLWFCESLHQIIRPEEAVVGTLKFVVKWDRSVQVAWDQRLETGSWSKDGLPKLTSGSVRIGLSHTPSWCHEKRHPTFAIRSGIGKDRTIVCIFFHWGQITSSLKVRLSHPLQYLS